MIFDTLEKLSTDEKLEFGIPAPEFAMPAAYIFKGEHGAGRARIRKLESGDWNLEDGI